MAQVRRDRKRMSKGVSQGLNSSYHPSICLVWLRQNPKKTWSRTIGFWNQTQGLPYPKLMFYQWSYDRPVLQLSGTESKTPRHILDYRPTRSQLLQRRPSIRKVLLSIPAADHLGLKFCRVSPEPQQANVGMIRESWALGMSFSHNFSLSYLDSSNK